MSVAASNYTNMRDVFMAGPCVFCLSMILLVSKKNNVCVCGWVGACVRVCVCTLLLLSIFLVFERFLASCFIEL